MTRSSPGARLAAAGARLAGRRRRAAAAGVARRGAHYAGDGRRRQRCCCCCRVLSPAAPPASGGGPLATGIVAALLAGYGSAGWRAAGRLADALDPALERADLVLTGVVASLPQVEAHGAALSLRRRARRHCDGVPVQVPRRIALGWSSGFDEEATPTAAQTALARRPALALRRPAEAPHGQLNPHGFDYELALVRAGRAGHRLCARRRGRGPGADAARRRRHLAGRPLATAVRDAHPARACPTAAPPACWRRWSSATSAPIAARRLGRLPRHRRGPPDGISGLHVTMFAWLAGAAGAARCGARRRAALLAAGAASPAAGSGWLRRPAYALFSGWGVPAQRTVWMLATVALLRLGRAALALAAGAARRAPWW